MSSIFGWSLPAGVTTLPGDEDSGPCLWCGRGEDHPDLDMTEWNDTLEDGTSLLYEGGRGWFCTAACRNIYKACEQIGQGIHTFYKDRYDHLCTRGDMGRKEDGCVTDPYGTCSYCIGTDDDFFCFDYAIVGNAVILHSVINSETGSFIMDGDYEIVHLLDSHDVATCMIDRAWDWCFENEIPQRKTHGKRDAKRFLKNLHDDVCLQMKALKEAGWITRAKPTLENLPHFLSAGDCGYEEED